HCGNPALCIRWDLVRGSRRPRPRAPSCRPAPASAFSRHGRLIRALPLWPPLVRLMKVVPPNSVDVFVKLEWQNPTGSMKDRMAQAVLSKPEADGRLKPGYTIVEGTGGSTGASLALICAVKGYRIKIVTSDAFSREKLDQMRAFAAELTMVPSEGGRTTKML